MPHIPHGGGAYRLTFRTHTFRSEAELRGAILYGGGLGPQEKPVTVVNTCLAGESRSATTLLDVLIGTAVSLLGQTFYVIYRVIMTFSHY